MLKITLFKSSHCEIKDSHISTNAEGHLGILRMQNIPILHTVHELHTTEILAS